MWNFILLVLLTLRCCEGGIQLARDTVLKPTIATDAVHLGVTFNPATVSQLKEYSEAQVVVWTAPSSVNKNQSSIIIVCSSNPNVAAVPSRRLEFSPHNSTHSRSSFNVTGEFLGYSYLYLQSFNEEPSNLSCDPADVRVQGQSSNVWVSVIRTPRTIDHMFVGSVALLVSLIYINFGCALNWNVLKETLKRPIGPVIGFLSQFGFMPIICEKRKEIGKKQQGLTTKEQVPWRGEILKAQLRNKKFLFRNCAFKISPPHGTCSPVMSFLLGRFLFPGNTAMQLGLFFTGCSPGGGASNIWTVVLGGNLDLSVTMTTLSTFAAFAMVPLWVFTIGQAIFEEGNLVVPYMKMSMVAAGLIIPLLIGTLIQFYLPKLAAMLVKIMKPFAVFLIIFIVIFGTVTNLYIFSLITWKLVLGGLCIPWLGYLFGALLGRILRQNGKDIIAIAVETGVQNTGISIYLLRFTLGQPEADLAQVCPVMVSLMTPIPLVLLALIFRLKNWKKSKNNVMRLPSTELNTPTTEQFSANSS